MGLSIKGRMKVKTLKEDFKNEFGLTLRVYNGRSFADDNATLATIRKNDNTGGEFSPKRNTKVGNLEDKIMSIFGIKTQVTGSDDSYFCDDTRTLAGALEIDDKLMTKKKNKNTPDNSNNLRKDNKKQITLKEVIEEIKIIYAGNDDLEEMVEDLSSNSYIDHWAVKVCDNELGNNKELSKKLFTIFINTMEEPSSADYRNIAESIAHNKKLSDKEWGRELFVKALELADDNKDRLSIAKTVLDEAILNDKNWAIDIFKQVEPNLEELGDYNFFISSVSCNLKDKQWGARLLKEAILELNNIENFDIDDPLELATIVADEDGVDDKEAAKFIFDKVKEHAGSTDLLEAARNVREIYADDDYALEYSEDVIQRATEFLTEGYYCDLYNFIKEDLEDEDRAADFRDEYEDEMRADYEELDICEELFGDESSVDIDDIDFEDYDEGEMLLCVQEYFIYDKIEDYETAEEGHNIARELLVEFIDDIKAKLEDNIVDKILLLSENNEFVNYNSELDSFKYDEGSSIYMIVTKDIPQDDINALFLSLDEYSFYVYIPTWDKKIITQGYFEGEYDTGFFSNGEEDDYINFGTNDDEEPNEYRLQKKKNYEKAKSILVEEDE